MIEFSDIQAVICDQWQKKFPKATALEVESFQWTLEFIEKFDRIRDTYTMESNTAIEVIGESSLDLLMTLPDKEQEDIDALCKSLDSYATASAMVLADEAIDGGIINKVHLILIDGDTWVIQAFYLDGELYQGTFTDGEMTDILTEYSQMIGKGKK